jgi:hypothetical protein
MYIVYIDFFISEVSGKSYILDILDIYHVHPRSNNISSGG